MIKALNQFLATLNNPLGQKLSGNEQLVLLHINNAMNTAYWAETLRLSDNSLLAMLNQYDSTGKPLSLETLRRIKQKLKGKGLIDFKSGKGSQISEYRLVKLYAENEPCRHPNNTPADTPKQSPGDLLNNNSNNNSTEDVKIGRQEDSNTTTTTAHASNFSIIGLCSEKVRVEWIKAKGVNPSYTNAEDLGKLERQHGTEKVVQAIINAEHANTNEKGINYEFVVSHLNKIIRPKGEMKNGRSSRIDNNVTAKNRRKAWDD